MPRKHEYIHPNGIARLLGVDDAAAFRAMMGGKYGKPARATVMRTGSSGPKYFRLNETGRNWVVPVANVAAAHGRMLTDAEVDAAINPPKPKSFTVAQAHELVENFMCRRDEAWRAWIDDPEKWTRPNGPALADTITREQFELEAKWAIQYAKGENHATD